MKRISVFIRLFIFLAILFGIVVFVFYNKTAQVFFVESENSESITSSFVEVVGYGEECLEGDCDERVFFSGTINDFSLHFLAQIMINHPILWHK